MSRTIYDDRAGQGTQVAVGRWCTDLDEYRHKAAEVLNTHVSQHGRCVACGTDWPCDRMLAAEFVLEL